MHSLKGKNAILTGASGGIGVFIAQALAREGVNLFLAAYPGDGLGSLCQAVSRQGVQAVFSGLDLRDSAARRELVPRATQSLGRVDLLINNAGVEYNARYDELAEENIAEVLAVNLEAPMMLTHAVLPQMLRRGEGHIVNMSSLAGKSGPAFQESYAASKAGLSAFTYSLRATYAGTGVSASVICPGFVEAGIYARLKTRTGCAAPALMGACAPERVAQAVIRAIRKDRPEIMVSRYPVRPLLALCTLSSRFNVWITARMGIHDFFRKAVLAQAREGEREAEDHSGNPHFPASCSAPSPRRTRGTRAAKRP